MPRRNILRIVTVNDVYELGNLSRLRSLVDKWRGEHAGPTIVTLNGDFVSPSILSSMDKGYAMVDCMNAVGITHCCFGNHEQDVGHKHLQRRIQQYNGTWLNSNIRSYPMEMPQYSIVEVGDHKVGLIGLLTDEPGVFRDNTFRGYAIEPVLDVSVELSRKLLEEEGCSAVVPLTHQSILADRRLATAPGLSFPLILGGHEHDEFIERHAWDSGGAGNDEPTHFESPAEVQPGSCMIIKTGSDAEQAAVIDISFRPTHSTESTESKGSGDTGASFEAVAELVAMESVASYSVHEGVERLVDDHLNVIRAMETQVVIEVDAVTTRHRDTPSSRPKQQREGMVLSSKNTRRSQTTMGALICDAVRQEIQADITIINGAPIKGNSEYPDGCVMYAQLKDELPFPTKMVLASLPGHVLQDAIIYSRTVPPGQDPQAGLRGYLQLDAAVETEGGFGGNIIKTYDNGRPFDPNEYYNVAVPRNLFAGFCSIEPLVTYGEAHPELAGHDGYIPAFQMVLAHYSKHVWRRLMTTLSFEKIDIDGDGTLTREEIQRALEQVQGVQVAQPYLDSLINVIDENDDGLIDRDEWEQMQEMLRETYPIKGGKVWK